MEADIYACSRTRLWVFVHGFVIEDNDTWALQRVADTQKPHPAIHWPDGA